jgi:hypothetical protein
MAEDYDKNIIYLADMIAATANRNEPDPLLATQYYAKCPNPLHEFEGSKRDTHAKAKEDAKSHDDEKHGGNTYCVILTTP